MLAKVKKDKENAALETADEFLMPKELYMEKIREIEKLKADVSFIFISYSLHFLKTLNINFSTIISKQ